MPDPCDFVRAAAAEARDHQENVETSRCRGRSTSPASFVPDTPATLMVATRTTNATFAGLGTSFMIHLSVGGGTAGRGFVPDLMVVRPGVPGTRLADHDIIFMPCGSMLYAYSRRKKKIMAKTAGILYIPNTFRDSAYGARLYLRSKGFSVSTQPFSRLSPVADMPRFPNKLDLMAWYSHGGWDGPVFVWDDTTAIPGQISPDEPMEWVQLMTYFKRFQHSECCFAIDNSDIFFRKVNANNFGFMARIFKRSTEKLG